MCRACSATRSWSAISADVSSVRRAASGCAAHGVERWAARRELLEVEVDGYPVRVKVSPGRVKVEHADAARVAGLTGRPVREVAARAEAAWRAAGRSARVGAIPRLRTR